MSKDTWTNPDDGVEYPEMETPINAEHEKIRREKIKRGERPAPKDRRLAPIEEKTKRPSTRRDSVTHELARSRHGAEYKAVTNRNKKSLKGEDE